MTWLLVGSEDGNSAVLYSEKPMISANELKYPDTSDNTPTQGGTDSQFQPKYKNEGGNKYATTDETIQVIGFDERWGNYDNGSPTRVYANHWGASNLRAQLNALFNSSN